MKINVCIGSACHLKGAYNVISALQEQIENHNLGDKVEVAAVFCLGHCTKAVSVKIDEEEVKTVSSSTVKEFFKENVMKSLA